MYRLKDDLRLEKEAVFDLVQELKPRDHVIMFYEYVGDKHRVFFDFLKAGLDAQEAVVYIAGADETPSQVRGFLEKRGVDVDAYEKMGMLKVTSYRDWYLIDGVFDVQRTITLCTKLLSDVLADGFKGLRAMGDVTWLLKRDMKEELLEFENSLHRVLDFPVIGVCAYSLPVLMQQNEVQLVVDLIKAHNNVIFLGAQVGLIKSLETDIITKVVA